MWVVAGLQGRAMRQIILLIAVVALMGCGERGNSPQIPANAFVNTLGMPFVPVAGTDVQFCIWETRVKDYAAYASVNVGVDGSWKNPLYKSYNGKILGNFTQEDTHPVVMVNRKDAQAFCAWLTKKELAEGKIKAGQKYRLPTDAEWSVAVGLGKEKGSTPAEKNWGIKGVYPWGKEWPPPKEAGNFNKGLKVDGFDFTAPVGSFAVNKFGLYDMGGNAQEWTKDTLLPSSLTEVLRGGDWESFTPKFMLSSSRNYLIIPGGRGGGKGFRCVLVSE